jgi:hypothetical protein
MSDDSDIRAAIRLIAPARALERQLEKARDLEIIGGLGDVASQNLHGLLESVGNVVDGPYVESLAPRFPEDATDEQKVSFVLLAVSQLVAYLESYVGFPSQSDKPEGAHNGPTSINFSPIIKGVGDLASVGEIMEKILGKDGMGADFSKRVKDDIGKAFGGHSGHGPHGGPSHEPPEPPEPPQQ